jgi:hypothetical protein
LDFPEKEKYFTTLMTDKLSQLAQLLVLPEKEQNITIPMTDKISQFAQLLVLPGKKKEGLPT